MDRLPRWSSSARHICSRARSNLGWGTCRSRSFSGSGNFPVLQSFSRIYRLPTICTTFLMDVGPSTGWTTLQTSAHSSNRVIQPSIRIHSLSTGSIAFLPHFTGSGAFFRGFSGFTTLFSGFTAFQPGIQAFYRVHSPLTGIRPPRRSYNLSVRFTTSTIDWETPRTMKLPEMQSSRTAKFQYCRIPEIQSSRNTEFRKYKVPGIQTTTPTTTLLCSTLTSTLTAHIPQIPEP